MKHVDSKKREKEILDLLVASYIKESHPISSSYLCDNYHLPYSSATVRNVLESLERQGLLYHIHTSSGRVPTKLGFKRYVEHLMNKEELLKEESNDLIEFDDSTSTEDIFNNALDVLSSISGYISLIGMWGFKEGFFFRGARFILNQPEFEDINKLKNLFYALEVKIEEIQDLLFRYVDEELGILIGDDSGFEEISDCSLLVSGFKKEKLALALALLGPMRMDYIKAIHSLYAIKHSLEAAIERML